MITWISAIIAVFTGLLIGSCYWTSRFGLSWLSDALSDDSKLTRFWEAFYQPSGGVGEALRREKATWQMTTPAMYVAVITAEIMALSIARRVMGTLLCFLLAVFLVVSIYTSFTILVSFVLAVLASIPLRSDKYGMEALYNMFRPVRLWMEADRATLIEYAGGLHIAGIMRVLDAKEGLEPRLFGAAA